MYTIFFFCQASGDIVHILQAIHNEHASNNKIVVLCTQKELLECWKFLNIKFIQIKYFPKIYPPILKPWKIHSWRKRISQLLKEYGLFELSNNKIYFTSIYDDPVIGYCVYCLYNKGVQIVYLNHYDDIQSITPIKGKLKFKNRLLLSLHKLCTGINFQLYNMPGRWNVLRFPIENIKVKEIKSNIDLSICQEYAYNIGDKKQKSVLFFCQPNRDLNLISNAEYDKIHVEVLTYLKEKGYYIIEKGHPIIGLCNKAKEFADIIIPASVPSELINLKSIKMCVGFMTIALSSAARIGINSYSFLPLIKDHNTEAYEGAIRFIKSTGDNKIKLINNVEEIE